MTKVLYFSAKWCAPCKLMAPLIKEIQDESPDVVWEKIDIDEKPEIAQAHDVMSIPTFLIYHDKVEKRIMGRVGKDVLQQAIA